MKGLMLKATLFGLCQFFFSFMVILYFILKNAPFVEKPYLTVPVVIELYD